MQVPWAKPYIGGEELKAVKQCFKTGWLSMGDKVREFEEVMSKTTESLYAIAVNSGTAALDIALKLIGIKEKDEVIMNRDTRALLITVLASGIIAPAISVFVAYIIKEMEKR